MTTFIIALIVLLTVGAALIFGVMLGYFLVSAILHTMARRPRTVPEPVLVATHTSGGD